MTNSPSAVALFIASIAVASAAASSAAFVAPSNSNHRHHQSRTPFVRLRSSGNKGAGESKNDAPSENFYNDFDDVDLSSSMQSSSSSSSDNNVFGVSKPSSLKPATAESLSDPNLFEALQKRQEQLQQSSRELLEKWTSGSAESFAAFTINEDMLGGSRPENNNEPLPFDWVRRVTIGTYPKVACGSAHGSVYVADVESKQLLGIARGVHSSNHNSMVDGLDEKLRGYLYGDYDGGGVLAVAMYDNLVASSGREGGVKFFQLSDDGELKYVGDLPSLRRPLPGVTPTLVTCLEFDSEGRLFVGGADGLLRMVEFAEDGEKMEVTVISSKKQVETPSPILSLDISEDLDMVASAHANGNVCIYSTNQEEQSESDDSNSGSDNDNEDCLLGVWNPFAGTNDLSHARSVAFVSGGQEQQQNNGGEDAKWSIVVGGGNGSLWMQEIHPSYVPSSSTSFDDATSNSNDSASEEVVSGTVLYTWNSLFKENSMQQIKPSHQGPVLSLATRPGGILVSTAHDGMLRVSQLWPEPRPLYGLGGYKVWIGNICIDREGKRLVSDGRDDVVVVHDFSMDGEDDPSL